MAPVSRELTMQSEPTIPNARAFVRSLNVLLKYARLYGLEHSRSAGQFASAWSELQAAVNAAGPGGLLLGASGSQLLLDGVPLESSPAERNFADFLNASGVASIGFLPRVERAEFSNLVKCFMETGSKTATLSDRLAVHFTNRTHSGIRVNEIRFVAEDSGFSDARVAATLTAKTLGADADRIQEWFRSPEKMIQLIAAAEGEHGGPGAPGTGGSGGTVPGSFYAGGSGTGTGSGTETGTGSGAGFGPGFGPGSGAGAGAGFGPGNFGVAGLGSGAGTGTGGGGVSGLAGGIGQLEEAELHSLLRLLAQFGEAQSAKNPDLDATAWRLKISNLPQNAQVTLQQALATVAAQSPNAKMDESSMLRLAEDLAIRFAIDRFQRGEVKVNAVRQMLDRMGNELTTLRKLLKSREEKLAHAGMSVESHADVLDRQFWAAVPDSGKKTVLMSSEAWCIPPRNVQQYVEELMGRGESDAAGDILLKYASCVRNKDAEARKKAAIGLGQLAELYSKGASQRLQDALSQIGQQLAAEKDPELQTLLSAAFVRLSQESAARRYYRAVQQALDSLADLEGSRPSWVQTLRPRIGVDNRIPEFIEEAMVAESMPDGLVGVLMRVPQGAAEHLAVRLARTSRRTERESVVHLAKAVGAPCVRYLKESLKNDAPAKAAAVIGLLSRLDPASVDELLPRRLRDGGRGFHDAVVRQLSTAGATLFGKLLSDSLEVFDIMIVPFALDEIDMCGDPDTSSKLLRLAEGEIMPQGPEYLRVKAIEE